MPLIVSGAGFAWWVSEYFGCSPRIPEEHLINVNGSQYVAATAGADGKIVLVVSV